MRLLSVTLSQAHKIKHVVYAQDDMMIQNIKII